MSKWLVFLLLVAALGVRLYRLSEPPLDFHQNRQYIGAIVARDFYFTNNPKIPEWRWAIAKFNKEHEGLLEPQILPTLAAWGYRLAGGEHLWIPRLISILCWLAGGMFLRRIVARLVSPGAAVVALAFYLFMPYAIMASRSFQPDPMMIMLMLASLGLVLDYDDKPTTGRLMAATVVLLIGMVVRPMAIIFVFPPFLFLMVQKKGLFRSLFHWHTALFVALPLLPVAAYYLYGMWKGDFIKTHSEGAFLPHLLKEPFYWRGWLTMIGRTAGWLPALVGLLAALFVARGRTKLVLTGLWGGYLAYGLIFNYHIHTHDYYSLPLLPIVAISLAVAVESSLDKLSSRWAKQRWQLLVAVVLCGLGLAVVAWREKKILSEKLPPEIKTRFKSAGAWVGFDRKFLLFLGREDAANRVQIRDFEKIGELVAHSSKTIQLADDGGTALKYHGEFWGALWPTAKFIRHAHAVGIGTRETAGDFEELVGRVQAEYFVVAFQEGFDPQAELKRHITDNYPVFAQGEHFIIYRLKRP